MYAVVDLMCSLSLYRRLQVWGRSVSLYILAVVALSVDIDLLVSAIDITTMSSVNYRWGLRETFLSPGTKACIYIYIYIYTYIHIHIYLHIYIYI